MNPSNKLGVVLFNLGGPDSLDAVKPFLYNLFQDPDIFNFPFSFIVRKPLAYLVASLRTPKSRVYFESMGGKSPIKELTLAQAAALEKSLISELPVKVVVAMRYWTPSTDDAIRELQKEGIRKIIFLPLYPQYSYTTTRSSVRYWKQRCKKLKVKFDQEILIEDYHDHPIYIQSVAERIREAAQKFPAENQNKIHLLFSAHGIPIREVTQGDPYETQIRRSVELIVKELGSLYPHHLSYQSKVGPLKWLEPTTIKTIERLAGEGVEHLIAVPISFVSDHSETLYELKKQYGELAMKLGIKQYELMPALNDSDLFIGALKVLVMSKLTSP